MSEVLECKTQLISHAGRTLFYMNFAGLRDEKEITSVIKESAYFIRHQPVNSVLGLTNIDGMHFNGSIKDLFVEFVKGNKPFLKASAVVGIVGLKQLMFNGVMKVSGRDIKSFNSIEEAKDWLSFKS